MYNLLNSVRIADSMGNNSKPAFDHSFETLTQITLGATQIWNINGNNAKWCSLSDTAHLFGTSRNALGIICS